MKLKTLWLITFGLQIFFPLLFVYINNIEQVTLAQLPSSIISVLVVFLLTLLMVKLLMKNNQKLLIVFSFCILLFFSYGHLYNFIRNAPVNIEIIKSNTVFYIFLGLVVGLFSFLIRKNKISSKNYLKFLLIFYVLQLISLSFQLGQYLFTHANENEYLDNEKVLTQKENSVDLFPDIYFLVFDEYARADILNEFFNFDNSSFVQKLKQRGFVIPEENFSNYVLTFLSLSSALDMDYVNNLTEKVGINSKDRRIPYNMMRNNRVANYLKQRGYLFVDFSNGWGPLTGNKYADIDININKYNEFFRVFISTTAVEPFVGKFFVNDAKETILTTLDKLEEISNNPLPTFTFSHLLLPHSPYLFDENGNYLNNYKFEFDKDLYLGQLKYANKRIIQLVDAIINNSVQPPIIILISDHGPESKQIFKSKAIELTDEQIRERFGNFTAMYLPGKDSIDYKVVTPVNIFRMIFNQYFNEEYPILENNKYYSNYQNPYLFIKVE